MRDGVTMRTVKTDKTQTELLMEDMDREPRMFKELIYDIPDVDINIINIGERSKPLGHEDEYSIDDYPVKEEIQKEK